MTIRQIKKINLNLVAIYYIQINLFLLIQFPVTVTDVDILVEMGSLAVSRANNPPLLGYGTYQLVSTPRHGWNTIINGYHTYGIIVLVLLFKVINVRY